MAVCHPRGGGADQQCRRARPAPGRPVAQRVVRHPERLRQSLCRAHAHGRRHLPAATAGSLYLSDRCGHRPLVGCSYPEAACDPVNGYSRYDEIKTEEIRGWLHEAVKSYLRLSIPTVVVRMPEPLSFRAQRGIFPPRGWKTPLLRRRLGRRLVLGVTTSSSQPVKTTYNYRNKAVQSARLALYQQRHGETMGSQTRNPSFDFPMFPA